MSQPIRTSPRPLRSRHSGEAGFTIIEVLVAALILAIVSASAAIAFSGAIGSSGQLRNRSAAEALAQQDEAKLHGLTVDQLAQLNTTPAPTPITVSIDKTTYTVKEAASYITDSTGSASCSNPSADYLQTTSTVSWSSMGPQSPVVVTGLLTPGIGSISPSNGSLAVSVIDQNGHGDANMNVTASSGSTTVTGTTNSAGCVLFGDIPSGTYLVQIVPQSGTYVDAKSNQQVTAGSPDTASPSPTVIAGSSSSASAQFVIAQPGTANLKFTTSYPSSVAPNPVPATLAPAAVFTSTSPSGPNGVVCSAADASCPKVGNGDVSFPASAFSSTLTAFPLAPYTYSTFAGTCANDSPSSPTSVAVTSNASVSATIALPAIVLRLVFGNPGSSSTVPASSLPSGTTLKLTDTSCGMAYLTSPPATLSANQAAISFATSEGTGSGDAGLLASPGMPSATYGICFKVPYYGTTYYDTKMYLGSSTQALTSFANSGSGEVVYTYSSDFTTTVC